MTPIRRCGLKAAGMALLTAAFLIALPARRVTGYVRDGDTGEPRSYRLNGLLVFVIVELVWAFELTGLPRDWFYRSTLVKYRILPGIH